MSSRDGGSRFAGTRMWDWLKDSPLLVVATKELRSSLRRPRLHMARAG